MVNAVLERLGLEKRLESLQEPVEYSFWARSAPVAVGNLQRHQEGVHNLRCSHLDFKMICAFTGVGPWGRP